MKNVKLTVGEVRQTVAFLGRVVPMGQAEADQLHALIKRMSLAAGQ